MITAGQRLIPTKKARNAVATILVEYFRGPVGFSFLLSWLYLSFYSCTLRPVLINARSMEKFWGLMAAAGLVTVIVVALWQRRRTTKLDIRIGFVGALLCGLGAVLLYVSNIEEREAAFAFVGPILSGIGFVFLGFIWKQALGNLNDMMIELSVPLSVFIAVPIYFALFSLRGTLSMVIIALLPLASSLFAARLINASESTDAAKTTSMPAHSEDQKAAPPLSTRIKQVAIPALTLFIIWVNIGFFRALWSPVFLSNRFTYYLFPFAVAAFLSLVVFGIALLYGKSICYENHQQVYRWVLPFACLAYALLCINGRAFVEAAYTANFIGIIITQLYFWTASAKLSRSQKTAASLNVFAWMFAALLAGSVCGVSIGLTVLPDIDFDNFYRFVPLIITLLITLMLFLSSSSNKEEEEPNILPADFGEVIGEQVRFLDSQFKFTPREQEILGMLLMGRSRPFIRDELGISLSTVNSHVKNIYEKAGVHSYQDLLNHAHRTYISEEKEREESSSTHSCSASQV